MFKRIAALFLAFSIVISSCISFASASGTVSPGLVFDFFKWAYGGTTEFLHATVEQFDHEYCHTAPNHIHDYQSQNTTRNGVSGTYYVCQYCGASPVEGFNEAYTQYTDQMQTDLGTVTLGKDGYYLFPSIESVFPNSASSSAILSFSGPIVSGSCNGSLSNCFVTYAYPFAAPVDGYYTYFYNFKSIDCNLRKAGYWFSGDSYIVISGSGAGKHLFKGASLVYNNYYREIVFDFSDSNTRSSFTFSHGWYVKPDDWSNETYPLSSRPTVLKGDLGYHSADGELQVIEDQTIVNEAENTITDPVTGESKEIESWVYDYIKRMYEILTKDGEKTTVTYGDEYITYETGDKTYNFYYVDADASGSGSVDVGRGSDISGFLNWWKNEWLEFRTWLARTFAGLSYDPDHTHEYKSTVVSDSTCITSGLTLFTCSCGDSYEERSDVLPHDYEFYQTIPATYDEQGNVVTDAYDMYVCSMCNRISRVPVDTQPSEETEDNQEKSLLGSFGLLRDLLSFFWNGFNGFIGDGIGKFITTSGDSSNDIFSILGEVDWSG